MGRRTVRRGPDRRGGLGPLRRLVRLGRDGLPVGLGFVDVRDGGLQVVGGGLCRVGFRRLLVGRPVPPQVGPGRVVEMDRRVGGPVGPLVLGRAVGVRFGLVADDVADRLLALDPLDGRLRQEPADVLGVLRTETVDGGVLLAGLELPLEDDLVVLDGPEVGPVLGMEADILGGDVVGDPVDDADVRRLVAVGVDDEGDGRDREIVGFERFLHPDAPPLDDHAHLLRVGVAHVYLQPATSLS